MRARGSSGFRRSGRRSRRSTSSWWGHRDDGTRLAGAHRRAHAEGCGRPGSQAWSDPACLRDGPRPAHPTPLFRPPRATPPAFGVAIAPLIPPFFVVIGAPRLAGRGLDDSDEFTDAALASVERLPEIAALSGKGLIEA